MKRPPSMPLGKSEKINVAAQRPSVNIKEAENVGEQAMAETRRVQPEVKFSKKFPNPAHPILDLWGRD